MLRCNVAENGCADIYGSFDDRSVGVPGNCQDDAMHQPGVQVDYDSYNIIRDGQVLAANAADWYVLHMQQVMHSL